MNNNIEQKSQFQILQFFEYQNSIQNEIEKSKKILQTILDQKRKLYNDKILQQKEVQMQQQQQIDQYKKVIEEQQQKLKSKGNKENIQTQLGQLISYQQEQNQKIETLIEQSCNENSNYIKLQEKLIKCQNDINYLKEEKEMKEKLIIQLQQITGVYLEYDYHQKILDIQLEYNQNIHIQIKLEDKLRIHTITPKNEHFYQLIKEFNQDNQLDKLIQKIQSFN
ncbi:unnamed protein product [Paramecium pentaurelia]|uniref:Kinetochore protein SPC25 n=1 Tax=Paramecium pentaurelia TaxID=43138 RepID=A0A8S1XGQ0_9CILI|nr:unnamed protein product [Paramecium pentaurelia]